MSGEDMAIFQQKFVNLLTELGVKSYALSFTVEEKAGSIAIYMASIDEGSPRRVTELIRASLSGTYSLSRKYQGTTHEGALGMLQGMVVGIREEAPQESSVGEAKLPILCMPRELPSA